MPEEPEKIKAEELRVEKLNSRHSSLLEQFKSSNKELKDFLIEDSLTNQELSISTTYLFFYKPLNKLVAYITVCTDAIRVHGTRLGKDFQDKGVPYKTLPAMKIARLSVDQEYEYRGIGTIAVLFAMINLLEINEISACRFITADAKSESISFYKKIGFEVLKEREKGTLPMYYDMIKQIEIFEENKKNFSKLEK